MVADSFVRFSSRLFIDRVRWDIGTNGEPIICSCCLCLFSCRFVTISYLHNFMKENVARYWLGEHSF